MYKRVIVRGVAGRMCMSRGVQPIIILICLGGNL